MTDDFIVRLSRVNGQLVGTWLGQSRINNQTAQPFSIR